MSKITSFKKTDFANIRAELASALAAVEEKFGIKLSVGSITFSDNEFSAKLVGLAGAAASAATSQDGEPKVNAKWVSDFMKYARSFGFAPSDLGREFKINGRNVKLVGSRSRANLPLVVQTASGSFSAMSVETVKSALRAA